MEHSRKHLDSVKPTAAHGRDMGIKGGVMVETMVACLVMSFAMFPLLQLALTTMWANNRSQKISIPLAFAKEKIEELMVLPLDSPLVADDGDQEDLLFYPGQPDQGSRTPDHPLDGEVANFMEDPVRGGMVEGIEHPGRSGTGQCEFFRVWNVAQNIETGLTYVTVIVYWYDESIPHRTRLTTILR